MLRECASRIIRIMLAAGCITMLFGCDSNKLSTYTESKESLALEESAHVIDETDVSGNNIETIIPKDIRTDVNAVRDKAVLVPSEYTYHIVGSLSPDFESKQSVSNITHDFFIDELAHTICYIEGYETANDSTNRYRCFVHDLEDDQFVELMEIFDEIRDAIENGDYGFRIIDTVFDTHSFQFESTAYLRHLQRLAGYPYAE